MFQAQSFLFFSENMVIFQQKVLDSNAVFTQFFKVQFIKCSKANLIKIITRT